MSDLKHRALALLVRHGDLSTVELAYLLDVPARRAYLTLRGLRFEGIVIGSRTGPGRTYPVRWQIAPALIAQGVEVMRAR